MEEFKKRFRGIVVSTKSDKTACIIVETKKSHREYHKKIKSSKKYLFHDEKNDSKEGDLVEIIESRPYSKRKKFKLNKIIKKIEIKK